MAHVQKRPGGAGGWRVRWRGPDGRQQAVSVRTRGEADRIVVDVDERGPQEPHAVRRVDDEGEYYVGRYRGPDGRWLETDEFYEEQDALAEARELAEAARAGGRPEA